MDRPSPLAPTLSLVLFATLLALSAAAIARVRAARPGGPPLGRWRLLALTGAVVSAAAVSVGPVATAGAHYLLTAHLLQATVLMGVTPPLLLLGLEGWRPRLAPRLRRALAITVHPAVAIVLVNAVFFGWHTAPLFDACLRHEELYALQLGTLLAASVCFWWPIVDPGRQRRMGPFSKLGYILLATVPQTFVGLLFALAGHPIYDGYGGGLLGLSQLADQQIAGACMALVSKVALFAAFSVVFLRMLDEDTVGDQGAGGDDGPGDGGDEPRPVPSPSPAWLGLLERDRLGEEPAPARPGALATR